MNKYNKRKVWEEAKGQITELIENQIEEVEGILTKQDKVVITIKLVIKDKTDGVYKIASNPDIEYELQSVASVSFDQAINEMEEIMKPVLLRSKAIQDKGERDKEMLKSWNDGNRLKIEEVT